MFKLEPQDKSGQVNEEVEIFTGSPSEIVALRINPGVEQVAVFAFKHCSQRRVNLYAKTLRNLQPFVNAALKRKEELAADVLRARINKLVDAMVIDAPELPTRIMTQAQMIADAKNAVLTSAEWLTSAQLAQIAGLSPTNPSSQPNKWKKTGSIFAVHHQGIDYFPAYGFDDNNDFRPRPAMRDIIQIFGESKDGWGLAYWFASVNGFLGGKTPQDLLATSPAKVIAAANDEMIGVVHG